MDRTWFEQHCPSLPRRSDWATRAGFVGKAAPTIVWRCAARCWPVVLGGAMQGMVLWVCVVVVMVVVVVVVVVAMVVLVIATDVLWPPLSCSLVLQQWSVSAFPTPCPPFETHLPLLSPPPPRSTRAPSFAATCLDEYVRVGFVSTTFHCVPTLFVDPGWNRCPVKSNKQ